MEAADPAAAAPPDVVAAAAAEEEEGIESEVFVPYVPTIPIRNAKKHPADIAESASLSCVVFLWRRERRERRKRGKRISRAEEGDQGKQTNFFFVLLSR